MWITSAYKNWAKHLDMLPRRLQYTFKTDVVSYKYEFTSLNGITIFNANHGSLVNRALRFKLYFILKANCRTSLVVQGLRICLPMQGTRVQSLVQEDLTFRGATKPVRHNY